MPPAGSDSESFLDALLRPSVFMSKIAHPHDRFLKNSEGFFGIDRCPDGMAVVPVELPVFPF